MTAKRARSFLALPLLYSRFRFVLFLVNRHCELVGASRGIEQPPVLNTSTDPAYPAAARPCTVCTASCCFWAWLTHCVGYMYLTSAHCELCRYSICASRRASDRSLSDPALVCSSPWCSILHCPFPRTYGGAPNIGFPLHTGSTACAYSLHILDRVFLLMICIPP